MLAWWCMGHDAVTHYAYKLSAGDFLLLVSWPSTCGPSLHFHIHYIHGQTLNLVFVCIKTVEYDCNLRAPYLGVQPLSPSWCPCHLLSVQHKYLRAPRPLLKEVHSESQYKGARCQPVSASSEFLYPTSSGTALPLFHQDKLSAGASASWELASLANLRAGLLFTA